MDFEKARTPVGESHQIESFTTTDKDPRVLIQDDENNAPIEQDLTPWQAVRAYPMAIFWCIVISTCVIMEGYDAILIQSFYAYPQFQLKYGEDVGRGPTGYQVSAPWQAGLSQASGVGAFFGVLANGYVVSLTESTLTDSV